MSGEDANKTTMDILHIVQNYDWDEKVVLALGAFSVKDGEISSSVAVNQEAPDGKATLKATSLYSIMAIENRSIERIISSLVKNKMGDLNNQKIYDYGLKDVSFSKFSGNSVEISSNVKIGPAIDIDSLKDKIKGKKSGEVRSLVESSEGVENVDIKFTTVPKDNKKINIKFTVDK